ncbi:MAG: capsule assembly Wzi family protein [Candidatus Neomarinimicrobiota bacterium]
MLSQFKKNNIINYYIGLLVILLTSLYSQDFENKYSLNLNSNFSNQWWSQYNNFGQKPSRLNFRYNSGFKKNKTHYYYSFIISKDRFNVGESFIKSQLFKNTYLKVGKYYKDFSLYLNDSLSSGSMLISNNAEPMPKIGILSSYNYKDSNFIFGIAHGSFRKSQIYTKAPFLHEKFIYLNLIRNNYEFGIGIVHEAMWGGATEDFGDFGNSFKDFLKVFISEDGPLLEGAPHANALGNHLGIWDFYYKRKINNKDFKLYYQHFFEDTSGLRFSNRLDGLWGIELTNYINNTNILIEYLNTENQDRKPPYVNENYYNHSQYTAGWSYKGYTLGNPFINHLNNNPSKVLHLGVKGNIFSSFEHQLKIARKINVNDVLKYQIIITKKFQEKRQNKISDLNIYIMNNEDMKNGLGIGISLKL